MTNLHTAYMRSGLLGLECKDCKHRAVLEANKWRDREGNAYLRRENMTPLDSIKFQCSACKGRNVRWSVPKNWEDAKLFMAGHRIISAVLNLDP